jgi:hypothetical protein
MPLGLLKKKVKAASPYVFIIFSFQYFNAKYTRKYLLIFGIEERYGLLMET